MMERIQGAGLAKSRGLGSADAAKRYCFMLHPLLGLMKACLYSTSFSLGGECEGMRRFKGRDLASHAPWGCHGSSEYEGADGGSGMLRIRMFLDAGRSAHTPLGDRWSFVE